MTKVSILKSNSYIYGFQIEGHSGYAVSGFDIVCAGVSTLAQAVIIGCEEVVGLSGEKEALICTEDENAYLEYKLSPLDTESLEKAKTLFDTFEIMMQEIEKQYSRYLYVVNVEE